MRIDVNAVADKLTLIAARDSLFILTVFATGIALGWLLHI